MIFIDIEASSLDADSWPIEVGLAWREGGRTRAAARLIRPEPDWPMSVWSTESAAVHGVTLADLRAADSAPTVAGWTMEMITDRRVVSDAPSYDNFWLDRLLQAMPSDVMAPRLNDFDVLIARELDHAGMMRAHTHLDRVPAPHRAGPDACRLLEAWLVGRGVDL